MNTIFDPGDPMDYEKLMKFTGALRERYPRLAVFSIGKTVLGRTIPAYIVGCGKPAVLYVGGVHALEYITSMLLVRFTDDLCGLVRTRMHSAGYDPGRLLATRSVYIVPMLNPDGVELHLNGPTPGPFTVPFPQTPSRFLNWQANARGVDLNHNFNAGFAILKEAERASGIFGPSPRQYGGPAPESEPETKALCDLCRRVLFSRVYAFHSQGEEIYWQYGPKTPRVSRTMARKLAARSGYAVSEPSGMAAHGGFKDWFISVFARPGFTIEVGKGVNPLPLSDFDSIYEKLFPLLMTGLFI